MNPNRPRHRPIQPTTNQIALGERLVGDRRHHLPGVAQLPQRYTHLFLSKNLCIVTLIWDKCDALVVIGLRPNQFEQDEEEEVLPLQAYSPSSVMEMHHSASIARH